MALPFAQVIRDAPNSVWQNPGPVPGGAFSSMGGEIVPHGTFVPGASFQSNIKRLAAGMNDGRPARASGKPMFLANDFIQHAYPIVKWNNDYHKRLRQGMLVFSARHLNQQVPFYSQVSIAQWNEISRQQHAAYLKALNDGRAEYVQFERLLVQYGEAQLATYHFQRVVRKWSRADLRDFYGENMEKELALLHETATKPIFRTQTQFGVREFWNFLGTIQVSDNEPNVETLDVHDQEANTKTINVTLGKRAMTGDYWGTTAHRDMRVGTQLHLYLTRARTKTTATMGSDSLGAFEIRTYGSHVKSAPSCVRERALPSHGATFYGTGRMIKGHVWYVGRITELPRQETAESTRETSLGIHGHPERSSHDAFGSLPQMEIQLGIK